MPLYQELKRRNVFRVAIAYLAGSWLLVEVAETIFPLYGFGLRQRASSARRRLTVQHRLHIVPANNSTASS
jgi:hypothetical protein